jgi:hypothetical protein
MKRINIISEAIYKGKIKQVNQGSFVNLTNIVNDIFTCFNIPCCENKADFFIRKAYLFRGRKKPGPNWRSLNKLVLDVYNCCAGTTLCQDTGSLQWWITTDVIRPSKTIETINFTNIIIKVLTCCELLDCCAPVSSPYNFDITADWSLVGTTPVTNQVTFEDWLTNDLGATSVVITSFDLTGNRLQANITVAGVVTINLASKNVTLVNKIGGFDSSLLILGLNSNQIVTFNPSIALPSSLGILQLNGNQIVTFNPTIPLPSSLTTLSLSFNQIVTFNPSIALPNSLTSLTLDLNQIVTLNPTIALPSSLTQLQLQGNQIVTFDPTLSLPSSLIELDLSGNQIVIFNPSNELPISLTQLNLANNQMTIAGYTASETWANTQTSFSGLNTVPFTGNVNSVSGTTLESILLTKNCNVIA